MIKEYLFFNNTCKLFQIEFCKLWMQMWIYVDISVDVDIDKDVDVRIVFN